MLLIVTEFSGVGQVFWGCSDWEQAALNSINTVIFSDYFKLKINLLVLCNAMPVQLWSFVMWSNIV